MKENELKGLFVRAIIQADTLKNNLGIIQMDAFEEWYKINIVKKLPLYGVVVTKADCKHKNKDWVYNKSRWEEWLYKKVKKIHPDLKLEDLYTNEFSFSFRWVIDLLEEEVM